MSVLARLAALLLALLALLAVPALGQSWTGPLAETATSRMFAPAVLPGTAEDAAMRRADYVQEEYLLSGEANIYGEKPDGALFVRTARVPYTTRLVLVRPRDPGKFNGIVHLGFTHPQLAGNNWARIDSLVLRTGAAYAVLVIGGDAGTRERSTAQWPVASPLLFRWFDPARYARFSWPDDDGIRWDVIGQAATALRSPSESGPLGGLKVRRLYVSGWSFLGSIQRSFINFGFHERFRRADGGPVIDGYLIGISAGSVNAGHVPLNSTDPYRDRTRDLLRAIDSPVIELTSEMEAITNVNPQREESDGAKGGHRIYELGGTSHGDSGVSDQIRSANVQLAARGHPAVEPKVECSVADTDVPMRDIAQGALVNLYRWVSTGEAPPRAARLEVAPGGKDFVRDRFGNPLGGVRPAQLDVPLVRYAEPDPNLCGGKVPRRQFKRLPLDPALLRAAYPGGRDEYLRRFRARLDELVRDRWLLAPDAHVQANAAEAFSTAAFGGSER